MVCSSVHKEKLSVSSALSLAVFESLSGLFSVSLPLILWNLTPKNTWFPQSKVKVNVLNSSDKSEDFRFVERRHVLSRSWVELWGKQIYTFWAFMGFPQLWVPWNHIKGQLYSMAQNIDYIGEYFRWNIEILVKLTNVLSCFCLVIY
jgi:hypothetical protein